MKKVITLIIALLAFVSGTQAVYAEATETLEVTLKSGIYLENYPEGALAMELLLMVNQIKTVQEGDNTFVYSMTDKKLLTVNSQTSYITLAPDVSSADDISYNVTDADRETIREADMEMYEVLKDYKTVRVHFDIAELQNLAVTLKSGKHIAPASEEWYAVFSLIIIGQLKGGDGYVYTSDNKLLFTLSPNGTEENMTYVVTLAPGISSADDIIYAITDEDRAILDNYDDPFYEAFLSNYKTIQLHFDTSEQEPGDWTVEIKSGMTLTLTTSAGMAWYLLSNLFHQLKNVQDEETEIIYVSTLDDKLLFMMDNNYVVTLAPGIGPADDITYTITDEERMQLRENQEIYPYIADVKTIQLHFIADEQQAEGWVAWLKTGDTFETNTKAQTAVLCLYLLNQVQYVEGEKEDVVYSLANKKLFTIEYPAGNIIIAPGVSSADDITYTLTDADREIISNYSSTVYLQMKAYKTIELHFDTSGGGGENLEGKWDFETSMGGWTSVDNDGDGHGWELILDDYYYCHDGYGCAGSYTFDDSKGLDLQPDDWFISPPLILGGTLSLWATGSIGWSEEHFALYISTTDMNISSFTQASEEFVTDFGYEQYSVNTAAYDGKIGYIAIRHTYDAWGHGRLTIDDISYDGIVPDPDGIKLIEDGQQTTDKEGASAWYSLDGRKLSGKPVQKGIYVNGGRKVLVK